MFEIYQRCSGLLVWLGESEMGDDWPLRAFAFFEKVYQRIKDRSGGYVTDRPTIYSDFTTAELTKTDWEEIDVPEWNLLRQLMENDYFSRLWIHQELGLGFGNSTTILMGVKDAVAEIQWLKVATFLPFFKFGAYQLGEKWGLQGHTIQQLDITFHAFHEGFFPDVSYVFVLGQARYKKGLDPRDKIYSTLSHPSARKFGPFPIDYEAPVDEVYRNFALEWMRRTRCVDILSLASQESKSSAGSAYPSWTPTFSEDAPFPFIHYKDHLAASKSSAAGIIHCPNSSGQFLCLAGFVLDEISGGDSRFSSPTDLKTAERETADHSTSIAVLWDQYCSMWPLSTPLNDISVRFKNFLLTLVASSIRSESWWLAEGVEYWKQTGLCETNCTTIARDIMYRWIPKLSTVLNKVYDEGLEGGVTGSYPGIVMQKISRRCLFYTVKGRFGLGPASMREGDVVAVFLGGQLPYVLRPTGIPERYKIVGDCYIYNLVHGEAIEFWQSGELNLENIKLA